MATSAANKGSCPDYYLDTDIKVGINNDEYGRTNLAMIMVNMMVTMYIAVALFGRMLGCHRIVPQ